MHLPREASLRFGVLGQTSGATAAQEVGHRIFISSLAHGLKASGEAEQVLAAMDPKFFSATQAVEYERVLLPLYGGERLSLGEVLYWRGRVLIGGEDRPRPFGGGGVPGGLE